MNQNKVVKTIEWEGACRINQRISEAKRDCIEWFQDDMSLVDGEDIIVNGDGRFSDICRGKKDGKFDPASSEVYYLFEVGLTKGAEDKLLAENLIE